MPVEDAELAEIDPEVAVVDACVRLVAVPPNRKLTCAGCVPALLAPSRISVTFSETKMTVADIETAPFPETGPEISREPG